MSYRGRRVLVTGADGFIGSHLAETRVRPENSEVRALLSDSRALRAATGWAPRVELKSGLAATVAWWRERLAKGQVRAGAHYMV